MEDIYSMEAEGKKVPDEMRQIYTETQCLRDSFRNGKSTGKKLYELSVEIDTSKVDRSYAEALLRQLKKME
jgi:hypothetical protein